MQPCLGWEASPSGASSPLSSPGRQVELRPHLCSHLERVWRGVAGAGLRPRGAQRDGPARLSDLQLIETPCSRRSARSPDSCRAEPGRMENPGCAGPTGRRGRGWGGLPLRQSRQRRPLPPRARCWGSPEVAAFALTLRGSPASVTWPSGFGGGGALNPYAPAQPAPTPGPVWGLWESHPQLPAPTPPPRPGSETSCLPGCGQLKLWEAGGAGVTRSPPPERSTGRRGPGGSVRGGGAPPGSRPSSGGAGAASVLPRRAGRPVAIGAGASGRERTPRGARFQGSGCGCGERPRLGLARNARGRLGALCCPHGSPHLPPMRLGKGCWRALRIPSPPPS